METSLLILAPPVWLKALCTSPYFFFFLGKSSIYKLNLLIAFVSDYCANLRFIWIRNEIKFIIIGNCWQKSPPSDKITTGQTISTTYFGVGVNFYISRNVFVLQLGVDISQKQFTLLYTGWCNGLKSIYKDIHIFICSLAN